MEGSSMETPNLYGEDYYRKLREEYTSDTAWKRNRIANVMSLLDGLEIKNAVTLDIACGIGTFTVELSKRNVFTVGLDSAINALNISSELFRETTNRQGAFVSSDALALPFASSSTGLVICADFIEHITGEDYAKLLSECLRVLKPGGHLTIYTPGRWHFLELMMRKNIILRKDQSHIDIKTMKRTVAPLKKAGFDILKKYYRPTHITLLRSVETVLMHVPVAGHLFRRRICVLARKPAGGGTSPTPGAIPDAHK
jgi:ubiquinone/menaquinone biosynthesis C-methylase UbiE